MRALAAFIVFTWHFIHVNNGHHAQPPIFPLSLLTEGHTDVALIGSSTFQMDFKIEPAGLAII